MSDAKPSKPSEGKPRSPGAELAPVAVRVEEGAMNRPLLDGYTVDREKVS